MTAWREKYLSSPKIELISLLALEGLTLVLFYFAVQSIRGTIVSGPHAWIDIQEILFLIGSIVFFFARLGPGRFSFCPHFSRPALESRERRFHECHLP